MATIIKGRTVRQSTVLVIDDGHSATYAAALLTALDKAHEVILYAGRPRSTLYDVKATPPPEVLRGLLRESPKNHPDGWYRQFEKRSKKK